jgi:hypothetical protein
VSSDVSENRHISSGDVKARSHSPFLSSTTVDGAGWSFSLGKGKHKFASTKRHTGNKGDAKIYHLFFMNFASFARKGFWKYGKLKFASFIIDFMVKEWREEDKPSRSSTLCPQIWA